MKHKTNQFVDLLIQEGWLKTPDIIKAFRNIRREDFVLADMKNLAELNEALPIDFGQTISQPLTVAFMLELLQPQAGDKILDIGSGSGWTTAILAEIVSQKGRVVAIEIIPELKQFGEKNIAKYGFIEKKIVRCVLGDGSEGFKKEAPYDKILVSATGQNLPEALKEQLKVGGRIVIPIQNSIWLFIKKPARAGKSKNEFQKNIRDLFSSRWLKNKDFSKISIQFLKKITSIIGIIFLLIIFYVCFEIYVPINPASHETIIFTVQKGWGDDEIANELQKLGIIRSSYFFKFYAILSLKHSGLQAGEYNLSPKMSAYRIISKMAQGDIIKDRVVILEGWDIKDIAKYLQSKGICDQNYFISLTQKDYSNEFDFLQDKPKDANLEGYLFPDTYEIGKGETCEDILSVVLANFEKKLTPALRAEIKNQKKSIFDVVIMASMIEKEVRTLDDKKIVSGILWKRLAIGMPLQLDSTINYITGKSDASVAIKDTKIDSPYNTYKYKGLPKGPISNPGINSITAAIYPTKTDYWYYLSDGKTFFSETLEQHNAAKAKYLK